jgi:hypothetical protein
MVLSPQVVKIHLDADQVEDAIREAVERVSGEALDVLADKVAERLEQRKGA